MTTFETLQDSIKVALNKEIQSNQIEMIDAMAMLWILGKAKNEAELRELIDIYHADYRFLQDVLAAEQNQVNQLDTNDIQVILSSYIKDAPLEATEVSKYLARNPSATLAELSKEFPNIKKYLA